LVYFVAIRYILWPFGIFGGHLIYLVYFLPILVCSTKKNLATLDQRRILIRKSIMFAVLKRRQNRWNFLPNVMAFFALKNKNVLKKRCQAISWLWKSWKCDLSFCCRFVFFGIWREADSKSLWNQLENKLNYIYSLTVM
jgi:hypothetical protein